jgi:hypothetical protein
MNKTKTEKLIKGYWLILPAIFTIAFLIFALILNDYFINLPKEKTVTTNPSSVLMKLNSTDKLVKLIKITFPDKPGNVTYHLEGPALADLLKLEEKQQNDNERFLYLMTKTFPQNFTNQTYEGYINMTYYVDSGKDNQSDVGLQENPQVKEKLVDLSLVVTNSQYAPKTTLNITK